MIERFNKQTYINLETFRKNGLSVKTPVWFVQEGDALFVQTLAHSGKVKRLKKNPQTRVAPCDARGSIKSAWCDTVAEVVTNPEVETKVEQLYKRKYGLLKWIFGLRNKSSQAEMVTLRITFREG